MLLELATLACALVAAVASSLLLVLTWRSSPAPLPCGAVDATDEKHMMEHASSESTAAMSSPEPEPAPVPVVINLAMPPRLPPSPASIPQRVLLPNAVFKTPRGRGTNRQIFALRERFADMCELESLSDNESFYCPEWPSADFPKTGELVPRAADPTANVAVLLDRVRAVYELATETFPYCSGVYAGKSSRTRVAERFSLHRAKVKGKGRCGGARGAEHV